MVYFKNNKIRCFCLIICVWVLNIDIVFSQAEQDVRMDSLRLYLEEVSKQITGLNEVSDVTVNDVHLYDFVRLIGKNHKINVDIDNTNSVNVTYTMTQEPVKNIFLFLCKKYHLGIQATGNILSFYPIVKPAPIVTKPLAKELKIEYNKGKLVLDVKDDTLQNVMRKVSQLTGVTIIPTTEGKKLITGYIATDVIFDAIEGIALMNGMSAEQNEKGVIVLKVPTPTLPNKAPQGTGMAETHQKIKSETLVVSENGLLTVNAVEEDLGELIRTIFDKTGKNYLMYDKLTGLISVEVKTYPLDELLRILFAGTKYTYKKLEDEVYVLGERSREGLRTFEIVKLKYRPTEKAIELIPADMKVGVEIKEYANLNRILLDGDTEKIERIKSFILEIDRPVPMVRVEMLVVDMNISRVIQTGIKAGLKQKGDSLSAIKDILPGIDYNLTGSQLNDLINAANVPFLTNLGALNSNFYLHINAQEALGNIKILTRPVISTLNGEEARLTIGETQYFKLQTTIANGGVSPITQVAEQFREIQYNTTLTIKPFVSDNDMLTLEVHPNFSTPGNQPSPNVPPNIQTREFSSKIRLKNGETVVIGGLSRDVNSSSAEGIPWLVRIPVIKWFFGSNTRNKTKNSLMIYITPYIYYN